MAIVRDRWNSARTNRRQRRYQQDVMAVLPCLAICRPLRWPTARKLDATATSVATERESLRQGTGGRLRAKVRGQSEDAVTSCD
jgi:hypothetical protein